MKKGSGIGRRNARALGERPMREAPGRTVERSSSGSIKPAEARTEQGVCVVCGLENMGTPAKLDFVISTARKMRRFLRMKERRTVACKNCLPEARKKREGFEKKRRGYLIWAGLFFAFVIVGSMMFGGLGAWTLVPAILGAIMISLLPFFSYFPSFSP